MESATTTTPVTPGHSAPATHVPAWHHVARHAVMPEPTHDEMARFNFLANLTKRISMLSPGNRLAWDRRAQSQFSVATGRTVADRADAREAMLADPYFQVWSSLRRTNMEMRQQAGRSVVLRQIDELNEKASALNIGAPTLKLDPTSKVPYYLDVMDNHCMPGSYHTELVADDVSAAANYDCGIFVTTGGAMGRLLDGGGKAIATHMQETWPDFAPKRILDLGCGVGHNTLPLAMAFPNAEVIAVDTGGPMLRYGHARAKSLGIDNVSFVQADAQYLDTWADGRWARELGIEPESFDYIQTIMFWHETCRSTFHDLWSKVHTWLAPGGLTLHVEQPQYTADMDLFEQFIRDWDSWFNNEPFWSQMHDIDVFDAMAAAGFPKHDHVAFRAAAPAELIGDQSGQPEDHGRAAIWNVFGAWKPAAELLGAPA